MVNVARVSVALLLVLAGYSYGVLSHEKRWPPTPQIERSLRKAMWWFRPARGFNVVTGRTRVDCGNLRGERTAVLLAMGQSNAANEGTLAVVDAPRSYNFNLFDAHCYEARDPLLGATGVGGSVWTRVARSLVAAGTYDLVVVAPIAVGGSSIRRWSPDGDLFERIELAQRGLVAAGLPATHVLWHQGESDVDMDPGVYTSHFRAMLAAMRELGIAAPVYVAQASLCRNQGSAALRTAQRALATSLPGVLPGPNTDEIDRFHWRRDFCHFSVAGLDEHARLWSEVLRR